MATLDQVRDIVGEVAHRRMKASDLTRTITEPISDSAGKDALRVTLVLTPTAVESLTGDDALDMLVAIQNELLKTGEERFAVVEYTTEAELDEDLEDFEPTEDET